MHNPISITQTTSTEAMTRMTVIFVMDTRRHPKQRQKQAKCGGVRLLNRGSYISSHVLLNLLKELGEKRSNARLAFRKLTRILFFFLLFL